MKSNRANEILEYLMTHESATVTELCEKFNVSDMTIRRDLILLESRHQITRFHGGAMINNGEIHADLFQKRLSLNNELKMEIGRACCDYTKQMIAKNHCSSIYIASGSTLYCYAKQLFLPKEVTAITDNIYVANALISNGNLMIITIGGQILLPSANAVGFMAEQMVASFTPDLAFVSAPSVDDSGSVYMFNLLEAGIYNTIVNTAKHIVLAVDHTKFRQRNLVQLYTLDERFTLITDREAPEDVLQTLRSRGVEIILV